MSLQAGDKMVIDTLHTMRISRNGNWLRLDGVESVRVNSRSALKFANAIAWTHGLRIGKHEKSDHNTIFTLTR